jgi:dihydropteroate synthase
MNYFYYLAGVNLQELRRKLKLLPALSSWRQSSRYRLAGKYYLLIATPTKLNHHDLVAYPTSAASAELDSLLRWAWCELTQDPEFIAWENQAQHTTYSSSFKMGEHRVEREYLPLGEVMLILNNTPDSFSEHGQLFNNYPALKQKIEHALECGVKIIDIGAESTRPGAIPVSHKVEITRLEPLLQLLIDFKANYQFKISLDSYHPETIHHFLPQIDIINDVSGALPPPTLAQIAAATKTYLFMHSLTIPVDPKVTLPLEQNPCPLITNWAEDKLKQLYQLGFKPEQLIMDVGIGFNKLAAQSWYLIRNIQQFANLGIEILVGHSRKRFMDNVTKADYAERDLATALIGEFLLRQGVDYLRLHDHELLATICRIKNQLE